MANIIDDTKVAIGTVETGLATKYDLLTALGLVARLKEIVKELSASAEAGAIAWIQANGEFQEGSVRYYVAANKTTKCPDQRAALEAVLEAGGGDLDKLAEMLASGAFKPGACRKFLPPEKFAALFVTTETADLKEGVAKPRLQVVNTEFQR